jgi:hypothetical protein
MPAKASIRANAAPSATHTAVGMTFTTLSMTRTPLVMGVNAEPLEDGCLPPRCTAVLWAAAVVPAAVRVPVVPAGPVPVPPPAGTVPVPGDVVGSAVPE